MSAFTLGSSATCSCRAAARRPAASPARPFTSSRVAPVPHQHQQQQSQQRLRSAVVAHFFRFGTNGFKADEAGIYGSQPRRDDYIYDDVEQYFNYMGFLATEGTYDRMEALLKSGLHAIDIILLLACSENDTPKVQEILGAGADPSVKGLDGKTPLELATKPELVAMLQAAMAKKAKVQA